MFDVGTLVASAARTTTGTSGAFAVGSADEIGVLLSVSAASGTTPSLVLSLEWSFDGGTTFVAADPADSMAALSAAGGAVKLFKVKAPQMRVRWTITGTTPSFTFTVGTYTN